MYRFNRVLRRQGGFSMAEVIIATALFAASVIGIAGMLVSGGASITKGAKESVATKLAGQKIEQVKPLPFYVPWDGVNQDIDDFFYTPVTEDYGDISGYTGYKRRTAVKYIVGTVEGYEDAVMDENWVPKEPGAGQFDSPKNSAGVALHGLIVEARVWYKDAGGIERELVENAMISDSAVGGPVLVINRVDPTHAPYNTSSLTLTAHVIAPGLGEPGQTATMKIWQEGEDDIIGTNPRIEGSGARVVADFNLGSYTIPPGDIYNVDVTWTSKGFTYSLLRCFTMDAPAPTISTIVDGEPAAQDYHTWGYGQQSGRKIKITGTELYETEIHLISPDGETDILGSVDVVASPYTEATATFNLGDATGLGYGLWDVKVKNATADGNQLNDVFTMNPKPVVTQVVNGTESGYEHFNWMYRPQDSRYVMIEGNYLCGLENPATTKKLKYGGYVLDGVVQFGPTGNSCNKTDPVMLEFNPSSLGLPVVDAGTNDTPWSPEIINICNDDAATISSDNQRVRMNPPPVITSSSGFPTTATSGTATPSGGGTKSPTSNRTYTGLALANGTSEAYIQNSTTKVYLVKGSSVDPEVNTSTVYALLSQGVTPVIPANGKSISALNMRVHVNPTNLSFMKYSGAAVNNNEIAGTYYVYFKNADGQTCTTTCTVVVSHASYTITLQRKQTWGTVSPGLGAYYYYQDETVSGISASDSSSVDFKSWQKNGVDYPGYTNPTFPSFTAGEHGGSFTLRARWRKYLFNGGQTVTWVRGYTNSPYSSSIGTNLYCNAWYLCIPFNCPGSGEVANVTNTTHSFAGAERLYVYWAQTQLWGDSYFIFDNDKGGDSGNRYGYIFEESDYGWRTQSIPVTSYQGSYYVRIHSRNDSLCDSKSYTNQVYLE